MARLNAFCLIQFLYFSFASASTYQDTCKKPFEVDILDVKNRIKDAQSSLNVLKNDLIELHNSSITETGKLNNEIAKLNGNILELQKKTDEVNQIVQDLSNNQAITTSPHDCSEILNRGHVKSGIYTLDGKKQVWCDMDTDFGGWTMITKRVNGKVNFRRNWIEYAAGFGNVSREYWIGNNQLRKMSVRRQDWVLRIDIWDSKNKHTYGEWDNFFISSEAEKYKINFGSYRGNLIDGQAMDYQRGMKFTTKDQDNDNEATYNCANAPHGLRGGWWFNTCFKVDLTMGYNDNGLFNGLWINGYVYIKAAEMKMRPMKF